MTITDLGAEALRRSREGSPPFPRGRPRRPAPWVLLGCALVGALVGWWVGGR